MSNKPKLLHPTKTVASTDQVSLDAAIILANRVLHENGMDAFKVVTENVTTWNGFYILEYEYIQTPENKTGGGATLVVRINDGLGGMVYCPIDWLDLELDLDKINKPIIEAYEYYDTQQC